MRKVYYYAALAVVPTALAAACYALFYGAPVIKTYASVARLPRIWPDYTATVIPPNMAPLDFRIEEPGKRYLVRFSGARGQPFEVWSRTGRVVIPAGAWKRLLEENRGGGLRFDVYVRAGDGHWSRYETITNTIAAEEIDGYLAYRLIDPVYSIWSVMGIYQRSLAGYDESLVLANGSFDNGCMNCHTFLRNGTATMAIQVRPGRVAYGAGMLIVRNGAVTGVDTRTQFSPSPAAYLSWHPSGRVLAFSVNKVRQFFHGATAEVRDVMDLESDLGLLLVDSKTVTTTPSISMPDRLETYPTWSPDGLYLYLCSAPLLWSGGDRLPPERYAEVRYDLMRISYDVEKGTWGEVETVLSARQTGKSITLPRISPDGRWLLFCMADYGCFPIHRESADLYMMDLGTGRYTRLEINSAQSDSWHSWSSNGRWIVFSSRRLDGLLARPYFSYVDQEGEAHKPFLLPQKDPDFYDGYLETYNLPELIKERIGVRGEGLARVIRSGKWAKVESPVTSASVRGGGRPGAGPAGEDEEPWRPGQ